jgi:hypothetical protein
MTNIITVAEARAFRKRFRFKCREGCRETMVGLDSQNASCLALAYRGDDCAFESELHQDSSDNLDDTHMIRSLVQLLLKEYLCLWPLPLITTVTHYMTTVPFRYLLLEKNDFLEVQHVMSNQVYGEFFENVRYVMYPSKEMVEKWNTRHGMNNGQKNKHADDPTKHRIQTLQCVERIRKLTKRELVIYEIVP